ncbi:MAG: 3'-5' exonuclease, partial [Cytophagales bacterium]|nr:3'-5' exonuclease [Cytophagales bacterium]
MSKGLQNILFLDIETVGITYNYDELSERLKTQWARKAAFIKRDSDMTDEELFVQRAGIYAEFGKIVTLGLGYFTTEDDTLTFRTKALYYDNEKELLVRFSELLEKINKDDLVLCAHNGREFDFPYLSRRMLVNGIPLPPALDLAGKKPWEVNHLDTMDLWKFGDYKHYTSLELLATIFDIDSSKTGMDGSMVNTAYYEKNQLKEIADYCVEDVIVTAQVYLKLKSISYKELKI